MWSGRLGGQSSTSPASSQPGSRSYSPAPRRTGSGLGPYITSQQRPGVSPRTSSLSLASSNDSSTSSLLASSRKPNGSALKQSTTAYAGPDPVDVLNQLLGNGTEDDSTPAEQPFPSAATTSITASDLELEFDFGGMTLRELALSEDPLTEGSYVHRSQTVEECTFAYLFPLLGLIDSILIPITQTNKRRPSSKTYIDPYVLATRCSTRSRTTSRVSETT